MNINLIGSTNLVKEITKKTVATKATIPALTKAAEKKKLY